MLLQYINLTDAPYINNHLLTSSVIV